ncbi:MAG: sugar phosphorylase [Candidatus Levybacteria bacterium]|nr:sugar phosphorylase [Candidatus Levybacteria bacterium]
MKNNYIVEKLISLYGTDKGEDTYKKLQAIIEKEKKNIGKTAGASPLISQKDIVLITYPDSFTEDGTPRLKTLHKFLNTHIKEYINTVHILPFNSTSSDRGFSVINYYEVKKDFGSWEDIELIGKEYKLMADIVLNHISSKSIWFRKFLQGDPKYQDFFINFTEEQITADLVKNLQKVTRPRATSILAEFNTRKGKRFVWTTFSVGDKTDQIDLNYKNPEVLLALMELMGFLLKKRVRMFRLDAATYIWKELGTNCANLSQVHIIVQLFRAVLDEICPEAVIVTETNVPHKENIAYFGNGKDESQMIYNFALPPLVLHAFYSANANYLTEWAKHLFTPSEQTKFFNFLACHDGIGMNGARGILPEKEIELLSANLANNGAKINYKTLPNGREGIYEVCATWWSALSLPKKNFEINYKRFLTSHAIAFALAGIPGIYYVSLFGKENDLQILEKTKHNRDILRQCIDYNLLLSTLKVSSKERRIFDGMIGLISERVSHPAFGPKAAQKILSLDQRIFAVLRSCEDEELLALHNITKDSVKITYRKKEYIVHPYDFLWETLKR